MIFLIFMFWGMLAINMDAAYEASYITLLLSFIIILAYIAHIFLLAIAVSRSAKNKGLASDWIWIILTFIFGLPAAILFALFTLRINGHKNKKIKNNSTAIALISLLLLGSSIIGTFLTGMFTEYYTSTHFTTEDIYYESEDGKQIIYDKMGKAYTRKESKQFKYYDRNGKTYSPIWDYDLFENEPHADGYNCIEEGKLYEPYEYTCVIDRDGYFVIFPSENELEYSSLGLLYDKNGNIYYYPDNCYWTPDGELIFNQDKLDKITYQDILDYEKNFPNEEY